MKVKNLLKELGIQPSKRFSQNFLIDPNIPDKIVKKAGVSAGDTILEIGPGLGSLTEALLKAGLQVIAIEKDKRFVSHLRSIFPKLILFEEDILNFPFEKLPRNQKMHVVANLPYNITSPLLTKLVPKRDLFFSMTVMIQDEVARRIVALPGSKEIGALSYFLNYYADITYLFRVSHFAFFPIPKVDSAVIHLTLRPPPPCHCEKHLFTLIRTAYQQRRKMLRSSLKTLRPPDDVEKALQTLSLSPKARPEELSLQDFIALSDRLA